MFNSFTIKGITVSEIYFNNLIQLLSQSVKNNLRTTIAYVNQNNIVLSGNDPELRNALKSMDYNFADGTGIWAVSKILDKTGFAKRFNLTDYCSNLFSFFRTSNISVTLLGSTAGNIKLIKEKLSSEIDADLLRGCFNGYSDLNDKALLDKINSANADILIVGLGSPLQEVWINENKARLNAKAFLLVGDLLNEITGVKKRGPVLFQKLGLEWLFRVIFHPRQYFFRYIIGIPKFFWYVFQEYFGK
jgi:N-acetylglucosaminyldiphosphoundecaprenol N-acetyl-beta-D-mannosaminyltransferase